MQKIFFFNTTPVSMFFAFLKNFPIKSKHIMVDGSNSFVKLITHGSGFRTHLKSTVGIKKAIWPLKKVGSQRIYEFESVREKGSLKRFDLI